MRLNERRKTFFLRIGTLPEKRKRENSIYDDDLPFQFASLTLFSLVALQMFTYILSACCVGGCGSKSTVATIVALVFFFGYGVRRGYIEVTMRNE